MTSELSDHVGYEDDFVGFLYVPPELQQGRHDEWVVWIKVSWWDPGDVDGLSLATLHRTPGGFDGEALVLKP